MKGGSSQRITDGVVTVGEAEFRWNVHREPQWCTEHGWKGLVIAVEPAVEPQRRLIIKYPFPESKAVGTFRRMQLPKISVPDVVARIVEAIDAGWNPDSRGKPFVFDVPG